MNITRRSFVKKTSFSAAAVSILGAGVALGVGSSTDCLGDCRKFETGNFGNQKYWSSPDGGTTKIYFYRGYHVDASQHQKLGWRRLNSGYNGTPVTHTCHGLHSKIMDQSTL